MNKKTEIQKLVDFALSDKLNQHKELIIGKVNKKQAEVMEAETGVNLLGKERFIDTSTIRHIIKRHGSEKTEASRGQVAINLDDFDLIPEILEKATEIKYLGKNYLKQDVFEYRKKIKNTYVVIEAIRLSKKKSNRIFISTMYKIKQKREQ